MSNRALKDSAAFAAVEPVAGTASATPVSPDHFVERDGLRFAGSHLLLDFWGAHHLDDIALIDNAMRAAAEAAGATLLSIDLHHFSPNDGISGVAVLAESHISIHTWPEHGFAAIDVFMCGDTEPMKAVAVMRGALEPESVGLTEHRRGLLR